MILPITKTTPILIFYEFAKKNVKKKFKVYLNYQYQVDYLHQNCEQ